MEFKNKGLTPHLSRSPQRGGTARKSSLSPFSAEETRASRFRQFLALDWKTRPRTLLTFPRARLWGVVLGGACGMDLIEECHDCSMACEDTDVNM